MEEIAINTTTSKRIQNTCFLSLIFFANNSLIKSMVSVELDAITKEDKVDMEADNTSITTSAISIGDNPESIVGITESNPLAAISI